MKFRNLILSAISSADISSLFPEMREISLARGEVLYEPGEAVETVFFPSSAVLSAVTVMGDGRQIETATVGHESMVGLLPALTKGVSAGRVFAQIAGGGVGLAADVLRRQAALSPELLDLLLRHADAGALQAERSVACNVLHDAPARLARWLLLTQDRTGGASFSLTQDYMAVMVGAQRSTISLVAGALKAAGLIRYTRGSVQIVDRVGLEKVACECYGVIRKRYLALAEG